MLSCPTSRCPRCRRLGDGGRRGVHPSYISRSSHRLPTVFALCVIPKTYSTGADHIFAPTLATLPSPSIGRS